MEGRIIPARADGPAPPRFCHFVIFLYSLAFWIQQNTLPFVSKSLGADVETFGYLTSAFGLAQLAGGPIYGRFADSHGGRIALTLAIAASGAGYALLAMADSITWLFLSRVPMLFQHAMQVPRPGPARPPARPTRGHLPPRPLPLPPPPPPAPSSRPDHASFPPNGAQMVITDLSTTADRAEALGRLGVSYGLGIVLGPFVGGLASKFFGNQVPAPPRPAPPRPAPPRGAREGTAGAPAPAPRGGGSRSMRCRL
eukprot:tig00020960_g16594.t1